MRNNYLAFTAAIAAMASMTAAHAGDQDFTISNHTGMSLGSMYVAPESDSKSWGADLFRGKVLPNGNEVEIVFSKGNQECDYAVAFKDSEGNEYEIHHVDLCTVRELKLSKDGSSIAYEAVK